MNWQRNGLRAVVLIALLAAGALAAAGCGRTSAASPGKPHRVVVLGVDGMDYELTQKLIDEGRMPNFSRIAASGGKFGPLGTSMPPLSPVAWSDFITGMDSGGHGIYDFLHCDRDTYIPYLSTSRTEAGKTWTVGDWQIPYESGKIELLRRGEAFWEVLEERGVETTILRIPANFPPSGTATRELSGMGTPDLHGTYGQFSFYTSVLFAADRDVDGGDIYEVWEEDGVVRGTLHGPPNPYKVEGKEVEADFEVWVDPDKDLVKLVLGDEERMLKPGEWSDWVPVEFEMLPFPMPGMDTMYGQVRFYLRSVRPEFELYASPINLDPYNPAMPISTPDDYAAELADASGRFYTQGMPEDTKALSGEVFDRDEFLAQAKIAADDIADQLEPTLDAFLADPDGGLYFFYIGNIDQVSHMMWKTLDPGHPKYDPEKDAPYAHVIPDLYVDIDRRVGRILDKLGDDVTFIVMSDHGFASWRRSFQLNSWLRDNGYLTLKKPGLKNDPGFFSNVDWSRTRAYGLGFNGLYVNLAGREKNGIVDPEDREALLDEMGAKLLAELDPSTGQPAITRIFYRDRDYHDRGQLELGPDMVVGYTKGTRCSSDSALGKVPPAVMIDHDEEWSGDHSMDPDSVPGILLVNRPLQKPAPDLKHLAASILAEFGIEDFPRRR